MNLIYHNSKLNKITKAVIVIVLKANDRQWNAECRGNRVTEHDKHYNQYPCKTILGNLDWTTNKEYVNNIPFGTPF